MRKVSVALTLALLTGVAVGQQLLDAAHENESSIQEVATVTSATNPMELMLTPTYDDLNCAGFISKQPVADSSFVAGGLNSPHETKFITGENRGFMQFDYHGLHMELVTNRITREDVRWAAALVGRLSERQWREAFRAGAYAPDVAERFIDILRARIVEAQRIGATATR